MQTNDSPSEPSAGDFFRAATRTVNAPLAGLGALIAVAAVVFGLIISTAISAVAAERIVGASLGSPLAALQASVRYAGLTDAQDTDANFPATVMATWQGLHGGGLRVNARGDDSGNATVAISTLTGRTLAAAVLLASILVLGGAALRERQTALPLLGWTMGTYLLLALAVALIPLGTWRDEGTRYDITGSPVDTLRGTLSMFLLVGALWALLAGRRGGPLLRAVRASIRTYAAACIIAVVVLVVAGIATAASTDSEYASDSDNEDIGLAIDMLTSGLVMIPDLATAGVAMAVGTPLRSQLTSDTAETYGLGDVEAETNPLAFWPGLIILLAGMAGAAAYAGYAVARVLPRPGSRTTAQAIALSALVTGSTWLLLTAATSVSSGVHARGHITSFSESVSFGVSATAAIFALGLFAVVLGAAGAGLGVQSPVAVTVTSARRPGDALVPVTIPVRLIRNIVVGALLLAAVTLIGASWSSIRSSDRADMRVTERALRDDLREADQAAEIASSAAADEESQVTEAASSIREARVDSKGLPASISTLRGRRDSLKSTLESARTAAR